MATSKEFHDYVIFDVFAGCSLVYPYDGSKTLMYSVDVDEKNRIKEFMEKFKSK